MLITDPIGDMIIRIKNAIMAKHDKVLIPHSKIKESISKILKDNLYIESYEIIEKKPQGNIEITLRYVDGLSAITAVKRLSKPGLRRYVGVGEIKPVLNGYGIVITSTNKGIMTGKDARKNNVGGELMCEIW